MKRPRSGREIRDRPLIPDFASLDPGYESPFRRDDLEHRIEIVEQSKQLDELAGIARNRDLPRFRRIGERRLLEHDRIELGPGQRQACLRGFGEAMRIGQRRVLEIERVFLADVGEAPIDQQGLAFGSRAVESYAEEIEEI